MRWDIDLSEQDIPRAVTGVDVLYWERLRALFAPVVPTGKPRVLEAHDSYKGEGYDRWGVPHADAVARGERILADNGGIEGNALAFREMHLSPLLAHRRTARNDNGKSLRKLVYVATFADGRTQRLSFSSAKNKPVDFGAGYNVSLIIGGAIPVRGEVEDKQTGERFVDPHFAPAATLNKPIRKESAALRLKAICKALNEGEIEAALNMARAA